MNFDAYTVTRDGDQLTTALAHMDSADLGEGDVLVKVEWSSVNFKDAMVTEPGNRVGRISPLIPGVDLAGTVIEADDATLVDTAVLVHGYDLGVAHHGGFAEYARVPKEWVVRLPDGLNARSAMAVGTAGFTALLSLRRLVAHGLTVGDGPVLVTGATGGVGSMAVALLANAGYEVVASSGKTKEHEYLRRLGASEIIGREELGGDEKRVLGTVRWAGAIDCVGGATLAGILRTLRYGAAVAASGLTGGNAIETTVYPFIVRNAALLGVDSVNTAMVERQAVWNEVPRSFSAGLLEEMVAKEIGLHELDATLASVLRAEIRGRVLVRPTH